MRLDFARQRYRQDHDIYAAEAWVGKARVGRVEVICTRGPDYAYLNHQIWAAPRKTTNKRGSTDVTGHQNFLDAVQGSKEEVEKLYAEFIRNMGYE